MNAAYVAPVPRPPHDPLKYRLDRWAGWRSETFAGLTDGVAVQADDGVLTLQALPGSGPQIDAEDGSFAGLTWPDHLAPLPDGGLVLLDRDAGRLRRFDRCECRFKDWPCLGHDEHDPRRPSQPGGIAIACAHLYLCDTGNARVLVFSLVSGTVRSVWSAPPAPEFTPWQPRNVAVARNGDVFVSDPANGGIHVLSSYGAYRRFIGGLGAVSSLAVDTCDRLYARIDGESAVRVLDPVSGHELSRASQTAEIAHAFPCLPIRVLSDGAVDVSTLCACVPTHPLIVDASGEPVLDDNGMPVNVPPLLPAYPPQGTWVSLPLDSGITRCTWHRVVLSGALPPGTQVQVLSWSAESEEPADMLALRPAQEWCLAGSWRNDGDVERQGSTDVLLRSPPGRYLWLKLLFTGDGASTPCLDSVEVEFPRISLRRYLPAIFGAEPVAADFTDRWLAIFDRAFRDLETVIDRQAHLFDPMACPAGPPSRDFLSWLASWIGITLERNLPEARRRRYLRHAASLFPWRGTVRGLRQNLYLFLGLERWLDYRPGRAGCVPCAQTLPASWRPPRLILEHFHLRRWMFLGHQRLSDNARLWGERVVNRSRLGGDSGPATAGSDGGARLGATQLKKTQDPCRDPFHQYAHQLSVFVPAACVRDPAMGRALKRLLELERPAHVQARIVPVEPRFRVGVQAMLGLDAVIGWQPQPVELAGASLGRGTVLGGGIDSRPRLRVGAARVGESTVLP